MRTGCIATLSCRPMSSLQYGPQPELTDSSRRSVELELKARHPEILSVTNVAFFEATLEYNTTVGGEPTQRLDAILVELREMRKELVPLIRSATFWFFAALGVLAFFMFWQNLS